jgi:hypothetical protein
MAKTRRSRSRSRSISKSLRKSKNLSNGRPPDSKPFSIFDYLGLEDCEVDEDGRFNGLAFPPQQSALIWRLSWLSLFSGLYAFSRGHYDLCFVPLGVWITSLLFWSKPDLSWRRILDIVYVQVSLWYQIWRATSAQYAFEFYTFTIIGMLCFLFSLTQKKSAWTSALLHAFVHILGNTGNVILYSGRV